ncbi:IRC22 [Candida pseudojiufengensis]|uniref:IRC22 n=1 Tax=Candida pseudojiufengensis TaxID=497109 RepID=UPI002224381D|nr:IRC22 [Candida pseudojiufengensis]KAI5966928.1 IRC22 [Candida pseudojiufengensis]
MKLSAIITALTTSIACISGYETTGKETVDILTDYRIKETPEVTQKDVANWVNGDEITLQYTVNNNEPEEITVIGVTGSFTNPVTNQIVTNLTQGRVGPVVIPPGKSEIFEQTISVDLIPNNYELIPQVFIAHEELIKVLPCRGQLASVIDKTISFFDPRLIFLEIVLLASFIALAYLGYEIWGKSYFKGTAPVKAVKVKKTGVSPAPVGSASTGATTYDINWIPEGHIKQKKTKKVA